MLLRSRSARPLAAGALLLALSACGGGDSGTSPTPAASPSPTAPARKPNFVFIVADDLDTSTTEWMSQLQTLVGSRGVTFANSFAATPLCCPTRATFLTGQYTHNHGIRLNAEGRYTCFERFREAGQERNTLVTWLKAAGYRTALVGKYLNRYPGDTDARNESYVPPSWDEWYAVWSDQGSDAYYNYAMTEANGAVIPYGSRPEDYMTDVLAGKAVGFVRRQTAATPFFLYVAPSAPHRPAIAAPRHEGAFPNLTSPRFPSWNEADMSDKPRWYQDPVHLPLFTDNVVRQIDQQYRDRARSLLAVDEMIQQIVQALEQTSLLDNTYIVFTSDNGFHSGHHRFPRGKDTMFEPSIRIPLVVRGPNVPAGARRDHLVSSVDMAQTIAELAGATPGLTTDGRSLAPLLGSSPPALSAWRQEVYIEHLLNATGPDDLPGFWGLRSATQKYVEHDTGELSLFDLQNDPDELNSRHASTDRTTLDTLSRRLAPYKTCRGSACNP